MAFRIMLFLVCLGAASSCQQPNSCPTSVNKLNVIEVHWSLLDLLDGSVELGFNVRNDSNGRILFVRTAEPIPFALGSQDDVIYEAASYSGRSYGGSPYALPKILVEELEPAKTISFSCDFKPARAGSQFLIEFGLVSEKHSGAYERIKNLNGSSTYGEESNLRNIEAIQLWINPEQKEGNKKVVVD